MKRKICVVTGSRAEYGLLYWIIKGIQDDPALILQLVVTGSHLSQEFGLTVRDIERDGFPIAERVEMLLSSDTERSVATSMGIAMIGFAQAYDRLQPDVCVVLGDRFEIFAAVASAVPFRIPVAHIHGGEATEGAMDELFRHSITKMSHIHFTATEPYAARVVQMGEQPENVFCFGAPGLDSIKKIKLLTRGALAKGLEIPANKKWGVVTYHPETLSRDASEKDIDELLTALTAFKDLFWIVTMPNADTGGKGIYHKIKTFGERNYNRCKLFASLGQLRYLSLLKHADIMVGNSSSGIIEAPSFGLPVVNIGDRQKGRSKARNVIDVKQCNKINVLQAMKKALSMPFRNSLKRLQNPYGTGTASEKIVEKLKEMQFGEKMQKKFFVINSCTK
jgi:UDP-hydrolysing UDP-N-acetyl-D-glucosamine 2-epimerase